MSNIKYCDEQIKYSDEQQKYIFNNNFCCNTRLVACPGSGKTTSILGRIKFMIESGIPSQKILFLSFNKHTVTDASRRMKSLGVSGVSIRTIDSLCWHLLGDDERSDKSLLAIRAQKIEILSDKIAFMFPLYVPRFIFIDEAQDLNGIHWKFISSFICGLAKIPDNISKNDFPVSLHLIGDPNQCIFQFRESSSEYLIDFGKKYLAGGNDKLNSMISAEYKNFTLSINFRSTVNIVNLANEIMPYKESKMVSGKVDTDGVHMMVGNKPKAMFKCNPDTILKMISDVFNSKDKDETVCIASPSRGGKSKKAKGLAYIAGMLYRWKIPVERFYDESGDNELRRGSGFQMTKDKVMLTTFHGLKGLEFDYVFIFDVYQDLIRPPTRTDHDNNAYLIYVALTRAIKSLYVCNMEHISASEHIHSAVNLGLFEFTGVPSFKKHLTFVKNENLILSVTEILSLIMKKPSIMSSIEDLVKYELIEIKHPNDNFIKNVKIDCRSPAFFGLLTEHIFMNCLSGIMDLSRIRVFSAKNIVYSANPKFIKIFYEELKTHSWEMYDAWKKTTLKSETLGMSHSSHYSGFIEFVDANFSRMCEFYEHGIISNIHIDISVLQKISLRYLELSKTFDGHITKENLDIMYMAVLVNHAIETFHYYFVEGREYDGILANFQVFKNIEIYATMLSSSCNQSSLTNYKNAKYHTRMMFQKVFAGEIDLMTDSSIIEIKAYSDTSVPFYCVLQLLMYDDFAISKKYEMINPYVGVHYEIKIKSIDKNAIIKLIVETVLEGCI